MANSTDAIARKEESPLFDSRTEHIIKSSEVLVVGGMSAVAAATGYIENMDTTASLIPTGVIRGSSLGDNTSTGLTGDAALKVIAQSNITLTAETITGVTSIADFGKLVYATDNQTFTLTKQATSIPVGFVKRYVSTGVADIQLFSLSECIIWGMLAQSGGRIYLGYLSAQSMGGTAAADLLKYTAQGRMQIDSIIAYPNIDDAAVAGAQTLNLEIDGTAATGDLDLAYTDCDALADLGTGVSATLTAGNVAERGDEIVLTMAASGTGFTDGTLAGFNVFLNYTPLAG